MFKFMVIFLLIGIWIAVDGVANKIDARFADWQKSRGW